MEGNLGQLPMVGEIVGGQWEVVEIRNVTQFHLQCDVRNRKTGISGHCEFCAFGTLANWRRELPRFVFAQVCMEMTQRGFASIQQCLDYGQNPVALTAFLVTTPIKPDLRSLRNALPETAENRFSTPTALHIALETLIALNEFHEAGYLHRRIFDRQFAVNRTAFDKIVMAIDNTTRRWRDCNNQKALPARFGPRVTSMRGTMKFSSINALNGNESTRLDDLWSWFYMIVDLTSGSLPWGSHEPQINFWIQCEAFSVAKKEAHKEPSKWLNSSPPEYKSIFEHLERLANDSEPPYDELIKLLKTAFARAVKENGGEFKLDWEPGGAYHEQLGWMIENADV